MEDCCGCTRKCKRIAVEDEASSAASGLFKRMRTRDSRELELISTSFELQNRNFCAIPLENSSGLAAGDSGLSCCSDHRSLASSRSSSCAESCEVVNERSSKSLDLEAKSSETETESSTCISSKLSTRETTPPVSDFCGGGFSDGMESQPKKQPVSHRKRPSAAAAIKPSNAEIEEFFSASEKYQQQRFAEKYNFDIVKDVPLEGRYQWVRLKH